MIDPLGIKKNDPLGLKKKVATKSVSQEELWGSDSQPQDLYTSLAIGTQEPQQVSDGLDGAPKMGTFTGFSPEELNTLQGKPAIKVSKSVDLINKRIKLQSELSNAKVTPENQAEISRKTNELSSIIKEQDKISNTRLSELEQKFKSSKDENFANAEAEKRLNNLITNTGVWNNVKSTSIDLYNNVVDGLSALTDEVGIKELKVDTDPLSEEKNKVIKDALKKKVKLSDQEIEEAAKKLYKDKQIDYIETDNINSFLDNLDDEDKNLLKQDRLNRSIHLQEDNLKQEKVINAYEVVGNKKIKEYQDIEKELIRFKSENKELPKDLYDSYFNLGLEIKGIANNISKRQGLLQKNKEDLGTVKQEFDFFKRQYGDVENFLLNTGTMARKLAVNTLGGLNYFGSLGGLIDPEGKNIGVQKDVIRINADIDNQRDNLRKSVESIESAEGFVNYVSDIMSNQIPSLVATSTGAGGLALIGVSTSGEKYADMNREVIEGKATYSPLQMAAVPFLYGASEVVSEIPTLSILKKGGRLLESISKNEADLITKSVKEKAKEWAKDWSIDTGKEIAGEEFTNFAQNFTDKYVLGKKDVGLLDNAGTVLKDTFTLTSILKAAPHVAGAILKPHQSNSDLLLLDENSRKIIEFTNQLDSNVLTEKEKSVVSKQMNNLVAKNSEIISNTIDKVDNMPVDIYKKVIELNDKATNIKSEAVAINDGVLPNKKELLKELSNEYKLVKDQRNALINAEYKNQAPLQEEFNRLDDAKKIELKDKASKILIEDARQRGLKEFEFNDKTITEKALELFKKEDTKPVTPAVEEPTIKDSQIPLKRETFEFESAEGEMLDVEVTTNKDGTRLFVAKNKDGRVISSNKVGEDNTLTTEEYVTKGYGDIQGEVKVEQGNDIIAPAMKDKLTPKQKAELGIEEAEVTTTTETEPITEAKPIETIEAKAKAYSEELDKTKESDPEAYWSVSPVSAEDAAKGTIIDTPDGAAIVKPDGDIAGLFKKATSKAKGVAQDLLKRAVAAGGKKLDNFDTYLTPQYIKAGFRVVSRVPFSLEYGVPDGYNKEKHGTPDVVAMVYDPEGKLDIEEKTFDDYDEAMAYRDSFIEPSIEMELEGLAKLFDESDRGFKMSQVDKAKEAIKGILPGVKFIVHDTSDAYNKATGGGNSSGTYITYSNGDKEIHINKQKANGRTVAHEVFHAVMLDKIKGDKSVQDITARMMKAVYKTASPELRARLDAFAAMYSDESIRDEERLAELIGIIADGYPQMSPANKNVVKRWLDALAKTFGLKPFTDNEVIDLLNTLAGKISTGEVISEDDVDMFNEEGAGGFAGVFKVSRQQKGSEAPKAKDDSRSFIRDLVEDVDIREFNGKKFITNMYDYTNAGETELGNGFKINLFGGKGYVPYMMELNNKKIGDVSNLAAFNTQAQAETFIRNAEKSGAELFAPHSGTKDQSWQFQQHTFAELVDVVLDKGILTNKELIDTFNNSIKGSKALKEAFSKFSERYGKKIKDFTSFKSDPKKIVDLLDIKNNFSPDLRKAFNNSIVSNKKFQEAIGIKNKEQFYNRIMDPLNNGVTGGEIMGVVKFDPNTFKIVETKPDAIDHHPSFGYTLLAKINGIYQPTEFHKSYDVTDSYTKYNTNETKVSIKSEDIKFNEKNVTSSAGAIPKVAEFKIKRSQEVTKKLQQANTIDEMVRIAKEAKYSDAAISAFLKAKGYSVEKITNAVLSYDKKYIEARQKEEGIFTREGRNKLLASLDSFKRMFLSARSFLSKTTFIAKEGIDAGIKAQSKIASYLVSDLDNAIKKYDGDKEKLISDFDKFIRGEEVDLPDNFIEIGNAMRSHIDKLSYELIKSGAVDEYQAENIKKNIGSYLNRSYEVFDKKNWASKVDELTLQSAKNYLKKQLLSEATKEAKESGLDVDILLERKANQAIANLLNKENAQSFVSSGKTGSKDVSILKEKSDIPLEIRALMGEYTDPAQNYSRTIFKIASLVNNAKFLNTVKSNGMNVYLFKEKTGEFNTQIAGKESETMNPLNGLYTTKEIAGALKESAGILNTIETALPFEIAGTVKSTYEYYMKLLGSVKHLKTIESVGTHFKNVSGNVTFMLANGYFKPDAYRQSAKVIYNDFFNKTDKELREKMQEYIEAGIVDQSAVLGELRSMFKDEDFDKSFERRMNSEKLNPANSFIDKIKRLGKKTISIAENAYQAEDDYFKIVAYETEKSRYARAIYTKEYSDLSAIEKKDVTDKVSEMVKNILPNYGRVAGAVKMVKAFPIVGTFISFQTEALRTAYNIVNLSVTELKSNNPEIKKIGALRMTGIISSQAVKYAVMYLIGGAVLGDDDDEKKEKAKEFVAPWSKNSNIVITDESNGKFSYVDFSASDPFGGIVKPMNAALGGEDLLDGFVKGLQELVTPFTTPDILRSMFSDILENKNSYGGTLYNPSDSFENKSSAILARVYKTFEPGTVTSVRKIYGSDNPLNEMAGQFTGYKSNDVDILKDFGFKISAMKKKEIETRSIYNRAVNKFKNKEVTDAELQAAYLQSNKATIDNYKELKKSYDAALYFGTDRKEIKESMKDAYVSADVIRGIVTGKFKDLKKKKGIETDAQLKARNPLVYRKLMLFRARHRK